MTEPTGQRIDGTPWDEARPPHLPDTVTRVSPWVYPFLAAALVHVWLLWTDLTLQTGLELSRVPAIAATLFGAAVFLRHPDARRAMPLLVFGVVLFAAGELLDAASTPITRFLDGLLPDADTDVPPSPLGTAWSVFTSLVGIFAVLYTAAGLSAARTRENVGAAGQLTVWLTVLAIASFAVSVLSLSGASIDTSPLSLVTLVLGLGLSLGSTLVWTYLLVVSLNGWLAGEMPRRGWALAAVAAALFLAIRLAYIVFSVIPVLEPSNLPLINAVGYGSVLAWVVLLAAFAVGLPAVTPDPPAVTPPGSAAG